MRASARLVVVVRNHGTFIFDRYAGILCMIHGRVLHKTGISGTWISCILLDGVHWLGEASSMKPGTVPKIGLS